MGDVQVVYCLVYNQGGLGMRSCIMGLKTQDPRRQKEQSRANIEQDTAIQENLLRNLWIAGHLSIYCFVVVVVERLELSG